MRILAVETSCDETAIALAEFFGPKKKPDIKVLSNIVSSQIKLHAKFGGVIPNLAKREHQKNLVLVLLRALKETKLLESNIKHKVSNKLDTKYKILNTILEREPELLTQFKKHILPLKPPIIDAIVVTYGPGLAPALWVGVNFAKAIAYLWNKPLIPINHMAGHIYSSLLQIQNIKYKILDIKFPALALLVSGGHTELVFMQGHRKYKIIGETRDDAVGEAFDKVARILGLGYPGGPKISRLAQKGDPKKYPLPSPMINSKDYNFSFSGLKTAVLYLVYDVPYLVRYKLYRTKYGTKLPLQVKTDIAASFQKAVVDVLVKKTVRAAKEYRVKTILLGGGVAANKELRLRLGEAVRKELLDSKFLIPNSLLTGDNALMIAVAAYFSGKKNIWHKIRADANARLDKM